ncbi:MAG: hypothetical protein AAF615_04585, partial [Pseudomonadota bacterium]
EQRRPRDFRIPMELSHRQVSSPCFNGGWVLQYTSVQYNCSAGIACVTGLFINAVPSEGNGADRLGALPEMSSVDGTC